MPKVKGEINHAQREKQKQNDRNIRRAFLFSTSRWSIVDSISRSGPSLDLSGHGPRLYGVFRAVQ